MWTMPPTMEGTMGMVQHSNSLGSVPDTNVYSVSDDLLSCDDFTGHLERSYV